MDSNFVAGGDPDVVDVELVAKGAYGEVYKVNL